LRFSLNQIPRDEKGHLPPPPQTRDAEFGARLYRRMWSRWSRFNDLRKEIMGMINHDEERMRMTLAGPVAALILAIEETLEGEWATNLISMINNDYCGEEAVD
jgi:hypothetical protein